MAQLPNVNGAGPANSSFGSTGALNDVRIDDFLKLMIAELQNQDPLNPLENDELIAQISQIRSVGATEKLTETLDSVLLGQNISSATNLIGAEIDAISDDNQRVTGIVERVSVASGLPKLHLDLNPRAAASPEAGGMEAGEYEYRVVWEDGGTLFGVDPLAGELNGKIAVGGRAELDQAILISNLPVTKSAKQVYRREGGSGEFQLVDVITDVKQSTYLDIKSAAELFTTVLQGTPQLVDPQRQFSVSLKNVGEIRPPGN
jgi:flagellar basal-body rod modification protein FlgD